MLLPTQCIIMHQSNTTDSYQLHGEETQLHHAVTQNPLTPTKYIPRSAKIKTDYSLSQALLHTKI